MTRPEVRGFDEALEQWYESESRHERLERRERLLYVVGRHTHLIACCGMCCFVLFLASALGLFVVIDLTYMDRPR